MLITGITLFPRDSVVRKKEAFLVLLSQKNTPDVEGPTER